MVGIEWLPIDDMHPGQYVPSGPGIMWLPKLNLRANVPGWSPSYEWRSHFLDQMDQLFVEGWGIYADDFDGPTLDDANSWMDEIVQVWDPPGGGRLYPFPNGIKAFDDTENWFALFQEDWVGDGMRWDEPIGPRKPSLSDGNNRGFPSPRDFNHVLISMAIRQHARCKRFLQARKLIEFGLHGGRPPSAV